MTRRWALALSAVATVTLAACEGDNATSVGPKGQDAFTRYVAIGTSISQGVQSGNNALVYFNQVNAWPALLARQAGNRAFAEPLMRAPGCFPPVIAPIALGTTLRGVSVTPTDTSCAGLVAGLASPNVSPFNNVAISGALTTYALNYTPEITSAQGLGSNAADASQVFRRKVYPLVLPLGKTQVTAMMAQNPTFVSVELGANEVLGPATSGVIAPGVNYVPAAAWQPDYDKVVDSVAKTGARAILVTVPNVSNIVSLRTGAELYADSAAFQSRFRVTVLPDCSGSQNLVFSALLVPGTISFAARNPAVPVVPLSCTNNPNATPSAPDYILTPDDVNALSQNISAMNAHIAELAQQHGWALLDINAVLSLAKATQPAYSVARQMTCALPYGPYVSLDGVHPTTAGQVKLANAAIVAIDATYGFTIEQIASTPPDYATVCP